MTAPPSVDPAADEQAGWPSSAVDVLADPRSTVVGLDDADARQVRQDPARGVVPIGALPPLEPPVRPERRRLPPPPTDRLRGWIVTAALTLVGGLIRLWNVGAVTDGGSPLFDEKYYAVQAAEVIRNSGVEDNQAFGVVVHPPLGKQLIALGEMVLGYNPTGWRIAPVIAGTLCILLIIRVTRRMTRSTLIGGIAGVLLISDSVSHVMARTALLDIFQELFVLAAFACLIADRDQVRARLTAALDGGYLYEGGGWRFLPFLRTSGERAGVALGARWWRFGCGINLGLATAIKYNGIYWVAAFGVLTVIWDVLARREVGIRSPIAAVVRRDLFPSLWSLAVLPMAVYVASWWAWFGSETVYPRHLYCADDGAPCGAWAGGGIWKNLADLWHNSLWQWTWRMLDFHSTLVTPAVVASRHPWESKPWSWPLGTRPLLTYAGSGLTCSDGQTDCVGRIFIIALPAMWWLSLFVAAWALWRAIARLDWRYAAVLVGYGTGYLPWFFNLNRQMYFFYVAPLAPFLVIGISLVLGDILGRARTGVEKRFLSIAAVALYVGIVVANFVWMLPILNGIPITQSHLTSLTLLPSWG